MFRKLVYLTIIATLLLSNCVVARWSDVRPSIQEATLFPGRALLRQVAVIAAGDSLAFAANEIVEHVRAFADSNNADINISTDPSEIDVSGEYSKIFLAPISWFSYDWMRADPNLFRPEADTYFIVVGDSANPAGSRTPNRMILIAATTVRGYLYAATSLWQALDTAMVGGRPMVCLEKALIRDAPFFPKRFIMDKWALYLDAPTYENDTLQFRSAEEHADSILRSARYQLLYSKGNGLIQFGDAEEMHEHGDYHVRIGRTVSRLVTGNAEGDRWQDFDFDWIQGAGRFTNNGFDSNEKREYACIDIQKTCRIDSVYNARYRLIPANEVSVVNWDFEDPLDLQGWQQEPANSWEIGLSGLNRLAHTELSGEDETAGLWQAVKVQDTTGIPARLLCCEFSVRSSLETGDTVSIEFLHRTPLGGRNGFDWDLTYFDEIAGGFHKNEPTASIDWTLSDTLWRKVRFQFYTLGFQWDSLRIGVKNWYNLSAQIDFDSVQVYETPVYHLYELPDSARAEIELWHYGEDTSLVHVFGNSEIDLQRVGGSANDYVWPEANVFINYDTSDSLTNAEHWKAVLRYSAFFPVNFPAPLNQADPRPNGTYGYYKYRYSLPDSVAEATRMHMRWFENQTRPYFPISGYFNRENELRFCGYSRKDLELAQDSGWSCSEIYSNFNNVLSAYLNQNREGGDPERPWYLYADMYSRIDNAKPILRLNNPFSPFDGFDQDVGEVPGADDSTHYVFIDWWCAQFDPADNSHDPHHYPGRLMDQWRDVPNPTQNNWEVMFDFQPWPEWDSVGVGEFRDSLLTLLRDLAYQRREEGYRFTGGILGEDNDNLYTSTWTHFDHYLDYLKLWWKSDPVIVGTLPFPWDIGADSTSASAVFRVFPVPYPEDAEMQIDSVILHYRFRSSSAWNHQLAGKTSDLYSFSTSLPDTGGYVEYRVWAFDDLGRYSSYPPFDTKWSDKEAGERKFFTFERRKKDPIEHAVTFYAPGIISTVHDLAAGGTITVRPLPGYRYSTMMVTDSGGIGFSQAPSQQPAQFIVAGADTARVVFRLADSASGWRGIMDDDILTSFSYVTFETGTDPFRFRKTKPGDAHTLDHVEFKSPAVFSDSVSVGGNASFTHVTAESGAVLTLLPGTDFAFADSGRMVVAAGAKLQAVALDTLPTAFRAAVDTLGWEGLRCKGSLMDTSLLAYCTISDADVGVLANHTVVKLEHCTITNCQTAVAAINGGSVILSDCDITGNGDGLLLTNLSTAKVVDCTISSNSGTGVIALSRSTAYLSDCDVSDNGGDGLAGGIGLYTGSEAFLKCTNVEGNTGSGITAYGGVVILKHISKSVDS